MCPLSTVHWPRDIGGLSTISTQTPPESRQLSPGTSVVLFNLLFIPVDTRLCCTLLFALWPQKLWWTIKPGHRPRNFTPDLWIIKVTSKQLCRADYASLFYADKWLMNVIHYIMSISFCQRSICVLYLEWICIYKYNYINYFLSVSEHAKCTIWTED